MFLSRFKNQSLPTSPTRAPKYYEESFKEIEQIIKYKTKKLKKDIDLRLNVRTVAQVIGEDKLKTVIAQVVDEAFVKRLFNYYDSTPSERQSEGLLLPVSHSLDLQSLALKDQDPERLQKIRDYYVECYKKGKISYLVHAGHIQGQDTTLSSVLISALMEESVIYRVADRLYEVEDRIKRNIEGVKEMIMAGRFNSQAQQNVLDATSAQADMVGTQEDETSSSLYLFLVKVKNILGNRSESVSVNTWLDELSGAVGFRRQFEMFEACKSLLQGVEEAKDVITEASKRLKIPKTEAELKTLELCMKLRVKLVRYCASKFEKYDSDAGDLFKQAFKNATSRGRQDKLQNVEALIEELDTNIAVLMDGGIVSQDTVIDLMSSLHLKGSNLPNELAVIIRGDLSQPETAPVEIPASPAAPSPNADVSISRPYEHVKVQNKEAILWGLTLEDFQADKCKHSVRKIIGYYGACSIGGEVEEMMDMIPEQDFLDLPERLQSIAVNGQVNVCQVLEELNPSDRRDSRLCFLLGDTQKNDVQLTTNFRKMWGRAILRQYEQTVGAIMDIYSALPDRKAANEIVLSALEQMVPLVQRGYNDDFADSIEDYLYDLELEPNDFTGSRISVSLMGERLLTLPKLKQFMQFQDKANALLHSIPKQARDKAIATRRSVHFFN